MLVLFLYFIVDAFVSALYGSLAGSISAAIFCVVVSVLQYIFNKKKGRAVSLKGVVIDACLLIVFVAFDVLSDSLENGHRLMAVVSALFFTLVFAISGWYSKINLLSVLSGNILDKVLDSPYMVYLMRNTMRRMSVWSAIAFVVYLLNYLGIFGEFSEFVDNWFVFIIVSLAFLTEAIYSRVIRKKYKDVEWVPLVTEEGKIIGQAPRPLVHNGSGWLHPVVHLHVFDEEGRILLQKRPAHKKIQPLKWDTAVGGHIAVGEKVEQALQREAREEVGLRGFTAQHVHAYVWHSSVENEYVLAFKTINNGPFEPEFKDEVDELRFWTAEEIRQEIKKTAEECNLTPNLCEELNRLGLLTNNDK